MSTTSIKRNKQMPIDNLAYVFELKNGVVYWRNCNRPEFNGKPAGYINKAGYVDINYLGTRLYAHRVAYALYYGKWPKGLIDHIDKNRSNNSPLNLRDVNDSGNCFNLGLRRDNASGVTGVYKHGKGWQAEIAAYGIRKRQYFRTFEKAVAWREEMKRYLHSLEAS